MEDWETKCGATLNKDFTYLLTQNPGLSQRNFALLMDQTSKSNALPIEIIG